MKNFLLFLTIFSTILAFSACKEQSKTDATTTPTEAPATNTQAAPEATITPAPAAAPQTAEPAQNAKGVWHFTCPKGCEGGAGTQGNCAKCGSPLTHNAAYHQQ